MSQTSRQNCNNGTATEVHRRLVKRHFTKNLVGTVLRLFANNPQLTMSPNHVVYVKGGQAWEIAKGGPNHTNPALISNNVDMECVIRGQQHMCRTCAELYRAMQNLVEYLNTHHALIEINNGNSTGNANNKSRYMRVFWLDTSTSVNKRTGCPKVSRKDPREQLLDWEVLRYGVSFLIRYRLERQLGGSRSTTQGQLGRGKPNFNNILDGGEHLLLLERARDACRFC